MHAPPIKLFVFPRMFAIPNLSPFCCKLETWLRIAKIPYAVVVTSDPRTAPRRKLPYIEDAGVRKIVAAAIADWRAVLTFMSDGPYFFGDPATSVDAVVFGTLAPTIFTPIETPIREFLGSQPKVLVYAKRMLDSFFPELATSSTTERRSLAAPISA
jgi:glutathione S-transferase